MEEIGENAMGSKLTLIVALNRMNQMEERYCSVEAKIPTVNCKGFGCKMKRDNPPAQIRMSSLSSWPLVHECANNTGGLLN
ncbi:hypothetical protein R6Q59_025831 [Mikania micrantha]